MNYNNIKLWFARNTDNKIVTINDINNENKNNTYSCPLCGSELKPKAIQSKRISPHFAHIDASKCDAESMVHFWFKHKFLEQGDEFTVISDKERRYICRNVLVEESYETSDGIYRPDMTIVTENDETIYFEFNYTNKKKVREYLDMWMELGNTVVEIDVKQLMLEGVIPKFKALFYNGKCFNVKKNDTYYNTIGRYKEEVVDSFSNNEEMKERIRRLDWLWDDILKYKNNEKNIEDIFFILDHFNTEDENLVSSILKKQNCVDIYREYIQHRSRYYKERLNGIIKQYNMTDIIKTEIKEINKYKKLRAVILSFSYVGEGVAVLQKTLDINVMKRPLENSKDVLKSWLSHMQESNKKFRITELFHSNDVLEEVINDLNFRYGQMHKPFNRIKTPWSTFVDMDCMDAEVHVNVFNMEETISNIPEHIICSRNYNLLYGFFNDQINKLCRGICCNRDEFQFIEIINKIKYRYDNYLIREDEISTGYHPWKRRKKLSSYVSVHYSYDSCDKICLELIAYSSKYDAKHLLYIKNNKLKLHGNKMSKRLKLPHDFKKELLEGVFIDKAEEYLKVLLELSVSHVANNYQCVDCEEGLEIDVGEVSFFINKRLNLPKRCKLCRKRKRVLSQ